MEKLSFTYSKISYTVAKAFILFLIFISLLANLIAHEKPIYILLKGQSYFPAFSQSDPFLYTNSLNEADLVIWPLIKYSSTTLDLDNASYIPPFQDEMHKHWLGTDKYGRDVLAGLIYGTRHSLLLGGTSLLLSIILGISIGMLAGFYGDHYFSSRLSALIALLTTIILFLFFIKVSFITSSDIIRVTGLILCLIWGILLIGLNKLLRRISFFQKIIFIPWDLISMKFISLFTTIPKIFLLLFMISIFGPSEILLIITLGILSWPLTAKLIRTESLRIKHLSYIESARAFGIRQFPLLLKHVLPNAWTPILVSVAFGFGNIVLLESSLSFLGFGVSVETVTWGKMISAGRSNLEAWWLIVFPGLLLFLSVLSAYTIGNYHLKQNQGQLII